MAALARDIAAKPPAASARLQPNSVEIDTSNTPNTFITVCCRLRKLPATAPTTAPALRSGAEVDVTLWTASDCTTTLRLYEQNYLGLAGLAGSSMTAGCLECIGDRTDYLSWRDIHIGALVATEGIVIS